MLTVAEALAITPVLFGAITLAPIAWTFAQGHRTHEREASQAAARERSCESEPTKGPGR